MKRASAVTALVILVGCAATVDRGANERTIGFPVPYRTVDNPANDRVEVYFTNSGTKSVCFGPENWPDKGILINNGREVSVTVGGKTYYLKTEQDYCPKCTISVKPSGTLSGYFKYESFGLPISEKGSSKTLNFRPIGFACRNG